jgi:hypothetical protein
MLTGKGAKALYVQGFPAAASRDDYPYLINS